MVLVSDGSASTGRIGWGAVIAGGCGIIAETHDGVCCHRATSWAAEWLGRLAALQLAELVGIPREQWAFLIADSTSASVGRDGGRPSSSSLVDAVRLAIASHLGSSPVIESFMPAQHDTGWSSLPAESDFLWRPPPALMLDYACVPPPSHAQECGC